MYSSIAAHKSSTLEIHQYWTAERQGGQRLWYLCLVVVALTCVRSWSWVCTCIRTFAWRRIFDDVINYTAVIAQLGERKTEDLKVSGSIPDDGTLFVASSSSCRVTQAHNIYYASPCNPLKASQLEQPLIPVKQNRSLVQEWQQIIAVEGE